MLFDVSEYPAGFVYFPSRAGASPGMPRTSLEAFIAARFERAYDAQVVHYCRHLMGIPAAGGGWRAAVGYTRAREGPLFLEHYLDCSVERAVAKLARRAVAREHVVEVGNLAATSPGAAREVIRAMGAHLRRAGFAWVTFTATRELRNTFTRLGLDLQVLAHADPRRVPGAGAGWGRYYAHDPMVMLGELGKASGAVR